MGGRDAQCVTRLTLYPCCVVCIHPNIHLYCECSRAFEFNVCYWRHCVCCGQPFLGCCFSIAAYACVPCRLLCVGFSCSEGAIAMSFRSSFCRIMRPRNSRSHSILENPHASDVAGPAFQTDFMGSSSDGALSVAKHALWFGRQSHIHSCYGNRASITSGVQSLVLVRTGYYASGLRAMHWITFSNYQRSGHYRDNKRKVRSLKSKSFLELKGVRSRFYSGGPDLSFPVLWTLIGANVVVYAMWHTLNYQFMNRHFMVSIDSVLSGRLHTILTSAFSQRDMSHLLSNLIGLYFFGSAIARIFGGKYLLMLYLAGAIGGSVGHLFYFAYVYPWLKSIPGRFYNPRYTPGALGASGAVTTVMLLHIFLYPNYTILFYMVVPMPAALVGAVIIGRDLWLAKQGDADVSVGGHLGGAVMAFLAFLAKRGHWF